MRTLKEADIKGKRVFVRVDFNVPMDDGKITDNNRIKAAVPTIQYLLSAGAKVILGTHLGRPEGKVDPKYSTIPLAHELAKILNKEVVATDFVVGPEIDHLVSEMKASDILVLGNLRFDPGEEKNDEGFAKKLASLAEVYVNDAFAVCHREAASVSAIAKLLPSYAGFLVASEVENLGALIDKPKRPFVLIIGGAKVEDKAGMIMNLSSKVDKILIGGAVANTFLSASGMDISESVYDQKMLFDCRTMLQKHGKQIIMPVDGARQKTEKGGFKILDIGPATVKQFENEIKRAKTIFWNGNLGMTEESKFAKGTEEVAKAVNTNKGVKIAAGGDTVGFLDNHGLTAGMTFVSTGGGAALEFLAGKKLPGIEALK